MSCHGIVSIRRSVLVGLAGAVMLLLLLVSGCSQAPAPKQGANQTTPATPQASATVSYTPTAQAQLIGTKQDPAPAEISYSGDVKPKAQVSLSAKTIGRIEDLTVDVGSVVSAGQVIGHLDRASLEAQLKQAEAALSMAQAKMAQMQAGTRTETIAQAQANLDSAQEKYAAMQDGGRAENIAQADAALRGAEARLAQLKAGPTQEQLDEAEAAVRAAKNQLYAVQAQADAYLGSRAVAMGALVFTKSMKEAQSGAAYEQINEAEARLAELKAGPTQDQLDQAQAAVDQANAALQMAKNPYTDHDLKQMQDAVSAAEQQLKLAKNPYTQNDFDIANASVDQAQANVDLVKSQLEETNIVAPMDGVVSEKLLSVGALVSPQVPILTIISSDLEIALAVEEARAGQIQPGQAVQVSVAAYPDQMFAGAVTSVAPAMDPRSRTFAVKVAVKDDGGKLKSGMFAKVGINLSGN